MPAALKSPLHTSLRGLVAALLSICFFLVPRAALAGPENCPPGPNCQCVEPRGLCIEQLHLNNPNSVHIKVYVLGNINGSIWQIIQGGKQTEGGDGAQTYVRRAKDGPTMFSAQRCDYTFVGSTSCHGWHQVALAEPSANQLHACEDYAEQAVAAAKDNVKFSCGYGGGRWADDYKAHYNACAFAPQSDAIKAERVARVNDLQTCKDKAAGPPPTPVLQSAPPPVEGSSWKHFVGVWDTNVQPDKRIELEMYQQGSLVQGNYAGGGRIAGRAVGNELTFSWTQPGGSGTGKFFITDDETSFSGTFSTAQDPNRFFAWGGRKVK